MQLRCPFSGLLAGNRRCDCACCRLQQTSNCFHPPRPQLPPLSLGKRKADRSTSTTSSSKRRRGSSLSPSILGKRKAYARFYNSAPMRRRRLEKYGFIPTNRNDVVGDQGCENTPSFNGVDGVVSTKKNGDALQPPVRVKIETGEAEQYVPHSVNCDDVTGDPEEVGLIYDIGREWEREWELLEVPPLPSSVVGEEAVPDGIELNSLDGSVIRDGAVSTNQNEETRPAAEEAVVEGIQFEGFDGRSETGQNGFVLGNRNEQDRAAEAGEVRIKIEPPDEFDLDDEEEDSLFDLESYVFDVPEISNPAEAAAPPPVVIAEENEGIQISETTQYDAGLGNQNEDARPAPPAEVAVEEVRIKIEPPDEFDRREEEETVVYNGGWQFFDSVTFRGNGLIGGDGEEVGALRFNLYAQNVGGSLRFIDPLWIQPPEQFGSSDTPN